MIPCVICFLLGNCSLCLFPKLLPQTPILISCFLLLILCCCSKNLRKYKIHWILAYSLGFFWANFFANIHLSHRLPENVENVPIAVVGTIVSLPEWRENTNREYRNREDFKPEDFKGEDLKREDLNINPKREDLKTAVFEFKIEETNPTHLWPNPGRVKLHYQKLLEDLQNSLDAPQSSRDDLQNPPESLQAGTRLACTVKLKRPHGYANLGSFDKERHYFLNRISAEGSIVTKYPVTQLTTHLPIHQIISKPSEFIQTLSNAIHRLRGKIYSAIFKALENSPFFGIIAALVVGTRDGISPEQWQVFRETGTGHLIAISGLHVGLVAGLAFGLVRFCYQFSYRLFRSFHFQIPVQIIAAYTAIFASILYALLAGFTVSTQRSVIMITVFMLGVVFRRRISVWRSYFIALGIVILLDPLSCLGVGFWLSFSAVAVIIYGMQNRIDAKGIWYRWGRAQWVVFLGLAPISLAAFQQVSWAAPTANLIAIPWVSTTVVPFALLGGILSPFLPRLGSFFLFLADASLKLLWPCLEKCLNLFLKVTWSPAQPSSFALAFSILGVALLLAPNGFPARKLGIIFLLPLMFNTKLNSNIAPNALRFTVLDVGQGLSAVVETAEHVLVFDTGPSLNEHFDTGQHVVLPFLTSRGKNKIDSIIISHVDNDHVGGLASIIKKATVKTILSSEPEKINPLLENHPENHSKNIKENQSKNPHKHQNKQQKHNILSCQAGQKWTWDGIDFEMLHPSTTQTKKRNDQSCVLRIQAGEHTILLTGDIETSAEKILIERFSRKLASTILVVPHHGSKTSSSPEFIKAVNPDYAIFPVGYKNAYGHPREEVVERYRSNDIAILDTVRDGAASFELIPNMPIAEPSRYRKMYKHFWRN